MDAFYWSESTERHLGYLDDSYTSKLEQSGGQSRFEPFSLLEWDVFKDSEDFFILNTKHK